MRRENRVIGDYEIVTSILFGEEEIAIGRNDLAQPGEKYLCGYIRGNSLVETLEGCIASDDFAEIMVLFGSRLVMEAKRIKEENTRIDEEIGEDKVFSKDDCEPITYLDILEKRVVVMDDTILRPEYKRGTSQLFFCTGGFGAQANARGRTCYVTRLYDGKQFGIPRQDIIGTISEDKLPEWAKNKLSEIQKEEQK